MNPIYIEFLRAFAIVLAQGQNLSLPESRQASTEFFTRNVVKEPVYKITDMTIPGSDLNDIPIRIFNPDANTDLPILMFFHSGGWVFGSIEDADALCRKISNRGYCIVVAVDYRLAPENPFPSGLKDCYEATKWVSRNAVSFGGDGKRIGVCGESSGANLAAAVALMSRDKQEFQLKLQLLLYPVINSKINPNAYAESKDQSFITLKVMRMFWEMYVPNPDDLNNQYVSPIKAGSFENLPPTYIVTAEFDPLREEGEAYGNRLAEFNVPVQIKRYEGALHTFLSLPTKELPEQIECLQDIEKAISDFL